MHPSAGYGKKNIDTHSKLIAGAREWNIQVRGEYLWFRGGSEQPGEPHQWRGQGHHPGRHRDGQAPHGPEAHPVQRALLQEYCKFPLTRVSIFYSSVSRKFNTNLSFSILTLFWQGNVTAILNSGNFSFFLIHTTAFFSHDSEQNSSGNNYTKSALSGELY